VQTPSTLAAEGRVARPVRDRYEWRDQIRSAGNGLKSGEKLVAGVIESYLGKGSSPSCFPGVKRIAAECGFHRATVHRHLDALERKGWLVREARYERWGRSTNRYLPTIPELAADVPFDEHGPVLAAPAPLAVVVSGVTDEEPDSGRVPASEELFEEALWWCRQPDLGDDYAAVRDQFTSTYGGLLDAGQRRECQLAYVAARDARAFAAAA
jgi:hypothetical protein